MSSLTTANTSFAPVDDRKRKRANAASSDNNEPTPITALPDFSNRNSDNDLAALHLVTILKAGMNKKEG